MHIILISPRDNKRVNLHVRVEFLIIAALIFTVLLTIFIYNITIFTSNKVDQSKMRRLHKENIIVHQEIEKLEEEFSKLNIFLDSIKTYDEKLRTYASLEPINDDLRSMGVGGHSDYDDAEELSSRLRNNLANLSETLDHLLARSRLQKESFDNLLTHLEEKMYMRNHTPSIIPVQGWFISGFGYRIDPFTGQVRMHEGLDIAAPPGTPIVAPADGVVKYAHMTKGLGLTLIINHGYGFSTVYGHCQRVKANAGTRVKRGDIIAYVGSTGKSTGPHLHYEVRISHVPVDPINYIITASPVAD